MGHVNHFFNKRSCFNHESIQNFHFCDDFLKVWWRASDFAASADFELDSTPTLKKLSARKTRSKVSKLLHHKTNVFFLYTYTE